jgi:hypothetical protein
MYYETEEIDKLLICQFCKKHLVVPKTLPCGSTICDQCEEELWYEHDILIACPLCKDDHERPFNGFPVNVTVKNLLKAKPHCAYDEKLYTKSLEVLDCIDNQMEKLKMFLKLDKIEDKIHYHCRNLLKSVDIKIRERKTKLNEFRDSFEEEINKYERTCIENLKKEPKIIEQEINNEVQKLMIEADSKLITLRQNFKRIDLDEDDLRKMIVEAHELNNKLISSQNLHDFFAFSGEPLLFRKSNVDILKEHIGELYASKQTNLNSERIKSSAVVSFNYKNGSIICRSAITPVNADKVAILYLMYTNESLSNSLNYQIRLRLYHRTSGKLLNEKTELHNTQSISCLSIASLDSRIYTLCEDQNDDYWLKTYDVELNLMKAVQLHFQTLSIQTSSNNRLNIIATQAPFIRVYDKELKQLNAFGQNEDPHEPYFIKNFEKIQFQNELIFVYDEDSTVYVILLDSGFLLKKIQVNQSNCLFQVDQSLRIVLLNPSIKTFFIYDLNAELIDQFEIKDFENISLFTIIRDGSLAVNDSINGIIKIY